MVMTTINKSEPQAIRGLTAHLGAARADDNVTHRRRALPASLTRQDLGAKEEVRILLL